MSAPCARWVRILLIVGLVFGGASASLQAQGYFGLSAGVYQPEEDEADLTETFGIRGGYRFHPRFGFEGSISRVDLADAFPIEDAPLPGLDFDLDADLTNFDFSLQWFPREGNLVIFGGPGAALLDAEVRVTFFGQSFSDSDSENILTVHAGLGYVWPIGDRFMIRPEARVRHYFGDEIDGSEDGLAVSYESTDYELGVTFGWRFGS